MTLPEHESLLDREAEETYIGRVYAPYGNPAPDRWGYFCPMALRLEWLHLIAPGTFPESARVLEIGIGLKVIWSKPTPAFLFSPLALGTRLDPELGTDCPPGVNVYVELGPELRDVVRIVEFIFKVPAKLNPEGFPF